MSTTPQPRRFLERHHFLLRRLHSLSGIVPIGAFLVMHLTTNASVLMGDDVFQKNAEKIANLPALPVAEVLFIFLPIAFHAAFGVVIWRTGSSNVAAYRTGGNVRYVLQRITGMIALVFILFHVGTMHKWGLGWYNVKEATQSTHDGIMANMLIPPFYAIGIVCSVYHFANGIWTSLITWGITVGPNAQRKAGYACAVFGVVLGLVGLGALRGFMSAGDERSETTEIAQRNGQ